MRMPEYLSPTSLSVWKKDKEDYYLQYLATHRIPRDEQTKPMSVGSAFDAYIKSYLYEAILPNGPLAEDFKFIKIFDKQVDLHNREWAIDAGWEVFELYKKCGALADIISELTRGESEPRFEFTVQGTVEGVPLLGKPDIWYVNADGQPIILDWKVNGYCSEGRSPSKGYVRLRDHTGNLGKSHKDALLYREHGIIINSGHNLEEVDRSWATQITTYAWLCGAPVGSGFISAIDQIYRSRAGTLSVAEHRCRISKQFQETTIGEYKELWEIVNSNYIFRDLSEKQSYDRQLMLDNVHEAYSKQTDLANFSKSMKPKW